MLRIHFHHCASLFFGSAVLWGPAFSATAALYHADGGIATPGMLGNLPFYSVDLGFQAGGQVNYDEPGRHAQADSVADPYGVHAHSYAQQTSVGFPSSELDANSHAEATFQDVQLSGPVGSMVTTSINMNLGGSTVAGTAAGAGGQGFANSSVAIQVSINGVLLGGGNHYDRQYTQFGTQTHSDGMLSAWGVGNTGFATPSFTVQSGVPFTVRIWLQTTAETNSSFGEFGVTAEANSEFDHTFSFALTGPVFNLSAGYTAGSTEAHIANNQLVFPPGDYNHDGSVDAADYTVWQDTLGSTADLRANGDDTNASAGKIDNADYVVWKSNFDMGGGSGAGGGANAAVPEPTSLAMFVIGLVASTAVARTFFLHGRRPHSCNKAT